MSVRLNLLSFIWNLWLVVVFIVSFVSSIFILGSIPLFRDASALKSSFVYLYGWLWRLSLFVIVSAALTFVWNGMPLWFMCVFWLFGDLCFRYFGSLVLIFLYFFSSLNVVSIFRSVFLFSSPVFVLRFPVFCSDFCECLSVRGLIFHWVSFMLLIFWLY